MTPRGLIIAKADRYLLRTMMPRMALALVVTLVALLLERILRLIETVTSNGAPLKLVLEMAVNLVPHYLGLALPATFCIAVLTTLAALSRGNELDALEGAGWSLRRIGVPFIAVAAVLAMISLPLFGFLQPYSRYAYRAIKYAAQNAGWSGRVEEGVFVDAGKGLVISAGEVDPTGRVLYRVFVSQREENGTESVFTARVGIVVPEDEGKVVRLRLKEGRGLVAGGWLEFDDLNLARGIAFDRNPFRPRGGSERELTFGELLTRGEGTDGLPPEPRYLAEFHARLVRAAGLIGVALMSIPLGVTRKRAPVWPRIALAIAILVAFNHILQTVQSLAALGRIDPALGLWSVGAVYILGSGWLYLATSGQGSNSPMRVLLRWFDFVTSDVAAKGRRLAARWSGAE
jgi:lipopolysaccharide export system permease protein